MNCLNHSSKYSLFFNFLSFQRFFNFGNLPTRLTYAVDFHSWDFISVTGADINQFGTNSNVICRLLEKTSRRQRVCSFNDLRYGSRVVYFPLALLSMGSDDFKRVLIFSLDSFLDESVYGYSQH